MDRQIERLNFSAPVFTQDIYISHLQEDEETAEITPKTQLS